MRRASIAIALVALAACGGPSAAKLHSEHAGQTTVQIKAAFGAPETAEPLPSVEEGKARERWFYQKSKLIPGSAAGDFIVVEFEGDAEQRMYDLDAASYKKMNPESE